MTIIKENDDGDKFGVFAQFMGRLLDLAELFYQLLSEDLRHKQQCSEAVSYTHLTLPTTPYV